jgi:hypothetical protein
MRKEIAGWEGIYEVSPHGKVYSVKRVIVRSDGTKQTWTGCQLKPMTNTEGYLVVKLSSPAKRVTARIHRLVAEAFIENPDDLPEVNHKDGNRQNPNVDNLEWVTPSQNRIHAVRVLRTVMPPMQKKLSYEVAKSIRSEYRRNVCGFKRLAKKYRVSTTAIKEILRGEYYRDDFYSPLPLPPSPDTEGE